MHAKLYQVRLCRAEVTPAGETGLWALFRTYFIEQGYDLCNKDSRLGTFGAGFDPSVGAVFK